MLLLEDLMVYREEPIDLESLEIAKLLPTLTPEQISNLCRVLSYTVVDMGTEPEELLRAIDNSKRKSRRSSLACEKVFNYIILTN